MVSVKELLGLKKISRRNQGRGPTCRCRFEGSLSELEQVRLPLEGISGEKRKGSRTEFQRRPVF